MRIFITGATGLIGRAVVLRLRRDGHTLAAWVRSPHKARALLGAEAELIDAGGGEAQLEAQLQRADAVVHLAGEPVVGKRWTARRRAALAASRGGLTGRLVAAMGRGARRPGVLVSASAVGIYGHRADETLHEHSAPGTDFLARLCTDWEEAANRAADLGVRVVTLRTGIVLGRDGGALAPLLPLFNAGLGGPVGDGQGYVPWIHLVDVAEVIARAVSDSTLRGPHNVTAPTPATWREFATAVGNALGRPAAIPVPALALKLRFGAAAAAVLGSQRAVPTRLQQLGFTFAFPELSGALRDVLASNLEIGPVEQDRPASPYLDRRAPKFVLRSSVRVALPSEEVFAFFCRPENLGLLTPSGMQFQITQRPEQMGTGARIDYRLKVGPLPLRWRTHIEQWHPGRLFVDAQEAGPYRTWWHQHSFHPEGTASTRMEDRVYFAAPFGLLGRLAQWLFITPQLKRIFGYRAEAIRLRFG